MAIIGVIPYFQTNPNDEHDSTWWSFRKVSVPFDSDPTCSGEGSGAQWSRFGAFGALGTRLGGALGTWQLLQPSAASMCLTVDWDDMSETESPQKWHTHEQYISIILCITLHTSLSLSLWVCLCVCASEIAMQRWHLTSGVWARASSTGGGCTATCAAWPSWLGNAVWCKPKSHSPGGPSWPTDSEFSREKTWKNHWYWNGWSTIEIYIPWISVSIVRNIETSPGNQRAVPLSCRFHAAATFKRHLIQKQTNPKIGLKGSPPQSDTPWHGSTDYKIFQREENHLQLKYTFSTSSFSIYIYIICIYLSVCNFM